MYLMITNFKIQYCFIIVLIFIGFVSSSHSADIVYIQDKMKNGQSAPKMAVVPAGRFLKGSPENEFGRTFHFDRKLHYEKQEKHDVHSFAISITEVTFDDYDLYTKDNSLKFHRDFHGRGKRPVSHLEFVQAASYAKWLSEQTGNYYRLPTEIEWEYAARAGSKEAFSTGKCIKGKQANFRDNKKNRVAGCDSDGVHINKTVEVASYPPNKFGIYDMHGNVSEWTMGCFNERAISPWEKDGMPWDGEKWDDCIKRIDRGGDWSKSNIELRAAARGNGYLGGIRLVRELNKYSPYPVIIKHKTEDERTPGNIFNDKLENGNFGPVMVVLPSGSFVMGSDKRKSESPKHKVTINTFAMSATEITIGEFKRFTKGSDLYQIADEISHYDDSFPVSLVSWQGIKAYTSWLSEQSGYDYRLPTSAEWEYAARANSESEFIQGSCMNTKYANFRTKYSRYVCSDSPQSLMKVVSVGSYHANKFGLYDMDGNLSEMVSDCDHKNYRGAPNDGSPILNMLGNCSNRIIRGSSYGSGPRRIAEKSITVNYNYYRGNEMTGFRLAREIYLEK